MKHYALVAAALCTSALVLSPAAQAKDIMYLLQSRAGMIETQTPTTVPYRFTMYVSLTESDSDGDRNIQAEIRIDPSKPAGSRARIVTSTNRHRKILMEFLEEVEDPNTDMASMADDFWCKSIHDDEDVDLSTYTVISETDTQAVLKPPPEKLTELLLQSETENMDKSDRKMKIKLMDRVDGHIVVSKRHGGTKSFKVGITRSKTIMAVVKIKAIDIDQTCAVAPNGHRYLSKVQLSFKGKGLGEKFNAKQDIHIADLTPIP